MSDLFHCFDGCAKKVWDGHEEAKQEAKRRREAKREAKRLERDAESEESDSEEEVLLPLDHPNALPLNNGRMLFGGSETSSAAGRATTISKKLTKSMVFLGGRKS